MEIIGKEYSVAYKPFEEPTSKTLNVMISQIVGMKATTSRKKIIEVSVSLLAIRYNNIHMNFILFL